MLSSHLQDAALAAAKAWSHGDVEPRHVAYAIAKHFNDRPEVGELLGQAKRALEPHGSAHEVPVLTDETVSLLESIKTPDGALTALKQILGDEGAVADSGPSDTGEGTAIKGEGTPEVTVSPESAPAETVDDVLADLDRLVGLDLVKEQVQSVIAVVQANQQREEAGLATVNPGLHLVFTGPPGTGKTTVARLMARLYAASGALSGSNFTEVDRSSLVAAYVGQTAIKTSEVITRTVPGVLFVDEAYSLTPTHASDFGAEAISTLVKAMEDRRGELAVIVAGYSDEMSGFLKANPGLRSRLKTFVNFPDYGPDELVEIFAGFAGATGIHLTTETLDKAEEVFEQAVRSTDFGNARFARSLFEKAYARMAVRAAEDGEMEMNELTELAPEDLQWEVPDVALDDRRIGFGHANEDEENPAV